MLMAGTRHDTVVQRKFKDDALARLSMVHTKTKLNGKADESRLMRRPVLYAMTGLLPDVRTYRNGDDVCCWRKFCYEGRHCTAAKWVLYESGKGWAEGGLCNWV